jgi:hypothetical protein
MANKHDRIFFEITTRLFIPIDASLDDLPASFAEILNQTGKVNVNNPKTNKKGKQNAQKS